MRIQSIQNYNYYKKQTVSNIKNKQKTSPSFTGYIDVFRKSADEFVNSKRDLERVFENLLESVASEPNTAKHKGFGLVYNRVDTHHSLWKLKDAYKDGKFAEYDDFAPLVTKNGNKLLAQCNERLRFSTPDESKSIEFWLDRDSDIVMERPYDKIKVYNSSGNMKMKTKYTTDYRDSDTTYYNKDGSENDLRNFFSFFGI